MIDFDLESNVPNQDADENWVRTITSEDRYIRSRRFLESQLRCIKPGQSLPSVRSIRQKCGIGLKQVQVLLDEFENRGQIERRDRLGIFKSNSLQSCKFAGIDTIDFVTCARVNTAKASPFLNELIQTVSTQVEQNYGRKLRFRQIWANHDLRSYEHLACDPELRAIILVGSPMFGFSEIFSRHNIATVELLPSYPIPAKTNITIVRSPSNIVSSQLEHLFSLGHTKIAYLDNLAPSSPTWQMLCNRESFYQTMAINGSKVDPQLVFYPGTNDIQILSSLEGHFSQQSLPTAVICYDHHLNALFQWANNNSLKIGDDISVVSTNDMPIAACMSPSVTSQCLSREKISELTLDALENVIIGVDHPTLIEIPSELIVRESTKKVKKSINE